MRYQTPRRKIAVVPSTPSTNSRNSGARVLSTRAYTLPTEILGLIFEACGLFESAYASQQCAFSLGCTTKYFREVALCTPFLWGHIEHTTSWPNTSLSRITTCLQRSKNKPLRIVFRIGDDNLVENIHCVLDRINPHIHRWQELQIIGSFYYRIPVWIDRLARAEAPNLKTLFIAGGGFRDAIVPEESKLFNFGAPRLLSVKFRNVLPQQCLPPLTFVRRLQIEGASEFSDAYPILNGLSHLTHLSIIHSCSDGSLTSEIHLPALLALGISARTNSHLLPEFLGTLRAPSLESLSLVGVDTKQLVRLFANTDLSETPNFPALRSLTIGSVDGNISAEHWDQLTVLFPHITDFTLIDMGLSTAPCNIGLGESGLLHWKPLNTFTLRGIPGAEKAAVEHTTRALLQLLLLRMKMGCPIRDLRISKPISDAIESMGHMADLDSAVGRYEVCQVYLSGYGLVKAMFW